MDIKSLEDLSHEELQLAVKRLYKETKVDRDYLLQEYHTEEKYRKLTDPSEHILGRGLSLYDTLTRMQRFGLKPKD